MPLVVGALLVELKLERSRYVSFKCKHVKVWVLLHKFGQANKTFFYIGVDPQVLRHVVWHHISDIRVLWSWLLRLALLLVVNFTLWQFLVTVAAGRKETFGIVPNHKEWVVAGKIVSYEELTVDSILCCLCIQERIVALHFDCFWRPIFSLVQDQHYGF